MRGEDMNFGGLWGDLPRGYWGIRENPRIARIIDQNRREKITVIERASALHTRVLQYSTLHSYLP